MTIEELIENTTRRIEKQFYADRPRLFWRDYRALVKAITRYGYECNERGWEIQPNAIYWDISRLLDSIRERGVDITYLPTYLEHTVRSHIGMRAEEIQALSHRCPRAVRVVMDGVKPVAEIVSSDTELIAKLHASILRRRKPKCKPQKQLQLF